MATSGSGRPNIILLIFDSLRFDTLSCNGGSVETPAFDRIAREGTVFEHAYAAGPGTPISHAALFSGQYPSTSGVVDQKRIPDGVPLLAERLSEAGYDTFGIPGPSRMGSMWGYDRGFDDYYETYTDDHPSVASLDYLKRIAFEDEHRRTLAKELYRVLRNGPDNSTSLKFDLLTHRAENRLSKPFYIMMNSTLAHGPYSPPRPYKEKATPELKRPRWHIVEYLLDKQPLINRDDIRTERVYNAQTTDGIARFLADPSYLNQEELDLLRAWYDACVRCIDDCLNRFLAWFEKSGLADETVLILTADHGEHFGEHDLRVHSHGLFDENLHVPLLMRGPGVPGGERYETFASLVDIFDTVCDLADVTPPETTDGRPLFDSEPRDAVFAEHGVRSTKSQGHRKYMSEGQREEFGLGRKSIRNYRYLYVRLSDGAERVYERPGETLIHDPDEAICRDFRERVFETLGSTFESANEDDSSVSDDVRSNMRELGYIE